MAPSEPSDPAAAHSWPDLTATLLRGEDLPPEAASWAMQRAMCGEVGDIALTAFLVALRAKGESVAELAALSSVMVDHAEPIEVTGSCLDIVGTGGDRSHTVNISTMSAIALAGCGVTVVKHGNRAASSSSGAADVLEVLGVRLDLTPDEVAQVAERAGITFCFAQTFHPAMRHVGPVRRELALPTVFNVLGPLTNPARPRWSVVGVADSRMSDLIAGVFAHRGDDAVVLRGDDGLDEATLSTTTRVLWVRDGTVTPLSLAPEDVGLDRHSVADLRGGDAQVNAQVAHQVFDGHPGAPRDAVVLNAAFGLVLSEGDLPATPTRPELVEAMRRATTRVASVLDDGSAKAALQGWTRVSAEVAGAR